MMMYSSRVDSCAHIGCIVFFLFERESYLLSSPLIDGFAFQTIQAILNQSNHTDITTCSINYTTDKILHPDKSFFFIL
jgi:hypothetical protein